MINLSVQNVTTNAGFVGGTIALQRQLSATSTFSLLQGSDAAVALGSDSVTLSAALAIGETITALVVESDGSGASFRQIAYALNITGAVSSTDVYHLVMLRGADTKVGAGAVNMGNFLFERGFIDAPFNATSTQFIWRSGTSTHFTLPTDGRSPTPSKAGGDNRLNGGDYVLDFTASGGGRTVSGTLTIKRDLGRSVPAYTFDRGARTRPAETFTNKCFSVSSSAELQALGAKESEGSTVLLSLGSNRSAFELYPQFSRALAITCLLQSEDVNKKTTAARINVNQDVGYYFDSIILKATQSELVGWFNKNGNIINITNGSDQIRISRCTVGAPEGTAKDNLPGCAYAPVGSFDIFENVFDRIQGNVINSCTNSSFVRNTIVRWNADVLFMGNATSTVINGLIVEGNWMGECVLANIGTHPDTAQFGTSLNPATIIRGYYKLLDNTSWGGAADMSFNGPHYTGDNKNNPLPTFECTPEIAGNFHGSLTLYGIGCGNNAVYQAGGSIRGNTSVRQLTGVTGARALGKTSGAQGFDALGDDGVTPLPFQIRFAGGVNYAAGANVVVSNTYCDGLPFGGGASFVDSLADQRPQSASDPVGMTPAQINPRAALFFDDPHRVVPDWSIYTAAQQQEILRDMYAAKPGSDLDKADGRVIGTWCVRRNGAPAKRNQYGTATLSVSAAAGQVTAMLSRVLGVDVICDVMRNGAAAGVAITIPAGQISASAAATFVAGDTILLKNDCGLLNPSVTAA